jgi:formylglycine-generating enzyme required for sulfatase activity
MKTAISSLTSLVFFLLLLFTACSTQPADAAKSANADLSTLIPSRGTLVPGFKPEITAYSVDLAMEIEQIALTGIKSDEGATVSSNNGLLEALILGANPITLTVTAADGVTVKNYTVTVNRSGDYHSNYIGALAYVPSGTFQRDGTSGNTSTVSEFRISEREITRAQFELLMGVDPVIASGSTAHSSGTSDPVTMVTWFDAIEFCNKLSLAEDLSPFYAIADRVPAAGYPILDATVSVPTWTGEGYRLPTDMEWTWAAMGAPADGRGEGVDATGYLKAFAGSTGSNALGDHAWYVANAADKTHPAGTKLPNELGIFDMSGNAYEWCWDKFNLAYINPVGPLIDYRGPPAESVGRIMHGGSWDCPDEIACSLTYRIQSAKGMQDEGHGFRVARR